MGSLLKNALNSGGGVTYHYRALKRADTIWKPFRNAMSVWLKNWKPTEKNILIIGPSGGYCINDDVLAPFKNIVAIDIDPLASFIFKRRHKNVSRDSKILFKRVSVFQYFDTLEFEHQRISNDLFEGEEFCVLFTNFLGQAEMMFGEDRLNKNFAEWVKKLKEMLFQLNWASFHDRLSGSIQTEVKPLLHSAHRLTSPELVQYFYKTTQNGEVFDHGLETLFQDLKGDFSYFVWNLEPKFKIHLIEGYFMVKFKE